MCNSDFADKQMAYQCQLIYSIFYLRASRYIGSIAVYRLLHCPFCVFSISGSGHEFGTIIYPWHFLTDCMLACWHLARSPRSCPINIPANAGFVCDSVPSSSWLLLSHVQPTLSFLIKSLDICSATLCL